VTRLNSSTIFFTIVMVLGAQVITCPSPSLGPSKPFPCYLHPLKPFPVTSWFVSTLSIHWNPYSEKPSSSILISMSKLSKWDQSPYAKKPHVSYNLLKYACFHMTQRYPIIYKPFHQFHSHCCLLLELYYFHSNTSFCIFISIRYGTSSSLPLSFNLWYTSNV